MLGTIRIENLPITLRGITVLHPTPSKAPWIPDTIKTVKIDPATNLIPGVREKAVQRLTQHIA